MEENLNESQRQAILNKRKEMFAKMGMAKAGTMVTESTVATGGANSSMAAKLAAIKNGSAKAELNKFITATSKPGAGNGGAGFQIPESKPKKHPNNPNNQEVKAEYKQEVANFGGPASPVNSELSMIDSMFGGDGPARMPSNGGFESFQQNPMSMDLNIDTMNMPTFNPQQALQKKMREKQEQQGQTQSPYLKFANNTQSVQEDFEPINPNGQVPLNVQNLQIMMEKIAKGIAEKTIKNVLSEYSEQQKQKNYFEYYNKEKGVIKMADGKLYKLTQVQLKSK